VGDKIQQESSRFKPLWIPAFAGMTIKGHCGLFPHSPFDVGRSMFDVHFLVNPLMKLARVTFLIRSNWPLRRPEAALNGEP
jgi:hypothetical protein